jgi:cysteine desulfurase / selenocysteine lyase
MKSDLPRLGDRSLFPDLRSKAYLHHAAISPASSAVRAAVERVIRESAEEGAVAFSRRLQEREALRGELGSLLGARYSASEIAFVPSTMYGLAAVALSLPWRAGDRVMVFSDEYPTNVTIWQQACALFGSSLTLLPASDFAAPGGPDFTRFDAELARGGVRLCAVSAVQFATGLRMPLRELAERCHSHGAELAVDAVQALGAVPLDVNELGIDYLAAGSHKWLMGADGAGVVYVRRALLGALRPAFAGAMSHQGALDLFTRGPGHLRYDRPLRDEARVFEGGMVSTTALAGLAAALSTLRALGIENIFAHIQRYHDALEGAVIDLGFRSLRAPDLARRSGILSFAPPKGTSAPQLAAALTAAGVICSGPDGVLRFAPHFWNSPDEVAGVLAELRRTL